MLEKKRGFIGPLGDDIPSIFPIVAGVLLFITTLIFLNQQVSATAEDFKLRQATQQVAYLSTRRGYYTIEEFDVLCKNSIAPFANNNNLKFAVVVKKFCKQGCKDCKEGIDLFNSNPFNADETDFPGSETDASLAASWREKMTCSNSPPSREDPSRKSAYDEYL